MKSKRLRKQIKKNKKTKKGGWFYGLNSSKCGVMNPNKTYSDNRRNCLRNKDKWNGDGVRLGIYPITCDRHQVEDTNFPGDVECGLNLIKKRVDVKTIFKQREFSPSKKDDFIDAKLDLMSVTPKYLVKPNLMSVTSEYPIKQDDNSKLMSVTSEYPDNEK